MKFPPSKFSDCWDHCSPLHLMLVKTSPVGWNLLHCAKRAVRGENEGCVLVFFFFFLSLSLSISLYRSLTENRGLRNVCSAQMQRIWKIRPGHHYAWKMRMIGLRCSPGFQFYQQLWQSAMMCSLKQHCWFSCANVVVVEA